RGGLVFYQSEPIISTNFIMQNDAPGIFSLSSSYPIMVEEGINRVSENGDPTEDDPEIMVKDISFPILEGGHNDIMDSTGGYLIYGDEDPRDIEIDITYNYWGTTDKEEIAERVFRPSGFIFEPFDEEPNTEYSAGSGGGDEMFATALSAETDSNYV
ncbi:MAG: hypothetical protein GWO41_09695, partial [candidate division Zixibacteria bacterium]|nr:hypothetical protein [candidate division Zixibacteria bacterium]NIW41231.1 hypothetical protein [candidate division Zixibacteria bacterium]NIX55086.1 hypothetical protein [candidate division Zixibacteria bacterium]